MPLKGVTGGRRIGTGTALATAAHGGARTPDEQRRRSTYAHRDGTDRDPARGYQDHLEAPFKGTGL